MLSSEINHVDRSSGGFEILQYSHQTSVGKLLRYLIRQRADQASAGKRHVDAGSNIVDYKPALRVDGSPTAAGRLKTPFRGFAVERLENYCVVVQHSQIRWHAASLEIVRACHNDVPYSCDLSRNQLGVL